MATSAIDTHPMAIGLSVIVEWDNAELAGVERAQRMLGVLAAQAHELRAESQRAGGGGLPWLRWPAELVLVFDEDRGDADALGPIVAAALPAGQQDFDLVWVGVRGARYYEMKNAGAARANGDLLLFVDSDVIPEPGWLLALLSPFADRGVSVAGGNTYVRGDDLYSKTFALFWFFDPPATGRTGIELATRFFANNVVMRRDVFLHHPFPLQPGISRGACVTLAATLRAAGVPIHRVARAQTTHPPPSGVAHFVTRAIAEGRDFQLHAGAPLSGRLAVRRLQQRCSDAASCILRKRRSVNLSAIGVPAAIALAVTYNLLVCVGEVLSQRYPNWMRRHFQL